jgi:hypothetical protein
MIVTYYPHPKNNQNLKDVEFEIFIGPLPHVNGV